MKSLQARLNLGLSIPLTLLMLLLWWISGASFNQIAEQLVRSRMAHDGEALLAALQRDDNGDWFLKEAHVGRIYQRIFSGHYYIIDVEGQELRSRSLWDHRLQLSNENRIAGPQNQHLLIWRNKFQINKYPVTIMVAEDITLLNHSLQTFSEYYAIGCLGILIILLVVQGWVVTRSFASTKQVTRELEALSEGELSSLSSEVPQEIKPLVDEVNRLLQLLSQRLLRSRNAMGNLAHSLKHPLNLLMQLAQQPSLDGHTKEELHLHTQQIHQLMERELRRARIAGAGLPGQHFDAKAELPSLVDVLKRVYHDKAIEISYAIDQTSDYKADRNDMLELLGNLLDNACKWARHEIYCEIESDYGLYIVIEDDGIGCDDDQLEKLTQRGVRIDESVSGSGLGLAIVKDIVELYQGELYFEHSDLGGLKVRIILP